MSSRNNDLRNEIINFLLDSNRPTIEDVHFYFNKKIVTKTEEKESKSKSRHIYFNERILITQEELDRIDEIIWDLVISRKVTPGTNIRSLQGNKLQRVLIYNKDELKNELV